MRIIVFSILVLFTFACTKDVDIDQPAYGQKVVVDGYIETRQPACIFLTMSTPYLTHYDSASIRGSFLNYAKITLTSSGGEEEVLTLYRENRFFPPFVYKSVSMRGQEGLRYDLKVEVKGHEITASTTIPSAPEIVDTRFSEISDTTGYVDFLVKAPEQGNQYLFTRVASQLGNEELHPSLNPVSVVRSSDQTPVWQRVLRVTEFGLYLENTESDFYDDYGRFEYDLRDTVRLIVGAVDSVSYEVLHSLFVDRSNQENPFAFNGNRIQTNINGGIGRWTGIGKGEILSVTKEE
jgi:hypothetical protein